MQHEVQPGSNPDSAVDTLQMMLSIISATKDTPDDSGRSGFPVAV